MLFFITRAVAVLLLVTGTSWYRAVVLLYLIAYGVMVNHYHELVRLGLVSSLWMSCLSVSTLMVRWLQLLL